MIGFFTGVYNRCTNQRRMLPEWEEGQSTMAKRYILTWMVASMIYATTVHQPIEGILVTAFEAALAAGGDVVAFALLTPPRTDYTEIAGSISNVPPV